MPLLDRQRRGVVLGAIRIGVRVPTSKGKTRPEKLTTFRLTSPDRVKIDAAAGLYGGEVKPWKPNEGAAQQWEVVTTVDRLPVRVPPGSPVDQNYEMWAATRQRLCDGVTEKMQGAPCLCPPDLLARKTLAGQGRACKPTTRLSLILADLPGLGVWSLTSTGDSVADELAATAEMLQQAELAGVMLPASLRLEQREARGSGELHRFAVPVLDVQASLAALEVGDYAGTKALPAAPAVALDGHTISVQPREIAGATSEPIPREQVDGPPAEPIGAPKNPQAVLDLALQAASPDVVKQLRALALSRGWLEEWVTAPGQEAADPLDTALYARLEAVGGLVGP